jgi:hypothetical protein
VVAAQPGVDLPQGFPVDLTNPLLGDTYVLGDRQVGLAAGNSEDDVPVTLGQHLLGDFAKCEQPVGSKDSIDRIDVGSVDGISEIVDKAFTPLILEIQRLDVDF